MSRRGRNLHRYLAGALASSMATHDGAIEAAVDFGTLPEPQVDETGVAPDVVALAPDGRIVIGQAKYGTAWRSAQAAEQLASLHDWRYQGELPWRLVIA